MVTRSKDTWMFVPPALGQILYQSKFPSLFCESRLLAIPQTSMRSQMRNLQYHKFFWPARCASQLGVSSVFRGVNLVMLDVHHDHRVHATPHMLLTAELVSILFGVMCAVSLSRCVVCGTDRSMPQGLYKAWCRA